MLELFYCNGNIFLEGTFIVVTAVRKWQDFLELTPPAESINFSAQVTVQSKCEFRSSVNFRRMCCFFKTLLFSAVTSTLRNKFDALQEKTETHTPNDEYENFINGHLETATECLPTKQRAKPRVPWETLAVRKKCANLKTVSKRNGRNPTNINALKLKKPQN